MRSLFFGEETKLREVISVHIVLHILWFLGAFVVGWMVYVYVVEAFESMSNINQRVQPGRHHRTRWAGMGMLMLGGNYFLWSQSHRTEFALILGACILSMVVLQWRRRPIVWSTERGFFHMLVYVLQLALIFALVR